MEKLSVHNLYYTYQGKYQKVEALKNITCEFEKGKLYAIIGESGSGKTTLLSVLSGLTLPTKGEVFVDQKLLKKEDLENYRKNEVSIIFQAFHLFPDLNVLENVMYPMNVVNKNRNKKKVKEIAEAKLKSVNISKDKYKKFPMMLSGGEQQRVAIARALASHGKYIMADEPTGNLDSKNSQKIIDIFKDCVLQGYCVIIVTHDLNIAKQADVVYKMSDGEIVEIQENGQ